MARTRGHTLRKRRARFSSTVSKRVTGGGGCLPSAVRRTGVWRGIVPRYPGIARALLGDELGRHPGFIVLRVALVRKLAFRADWIFDGECRHWRGIQRLR